MRAGLGIYIPALYIYPLALKHLRMICLLCFSLHDYCLCLFVSLDYCILHAYPVHPQVSSGSTRGESKVTCPSYLCIPRVPDFQIQSLVKAFPSGNSSSLILFPDFISGGTLSTLFHSIRYIYPNTDFKP